MQVRYELADASDGALVSIHARGKARGFFRIASPLLNQMVRRNIRKGLELLRTGSPGSTSPPRRSQVDGQCTPGRTRARGLPRRWASPCSNRSSRCPNTIGQANEGRRLSISEVGALQNCARRGPRRVRPR
jgi:hypothetical protein